MASFMTIILSNYKKETKNSDAEIIAKLQKMLHREHLYNCDDTSCSINFAAENDYWHLAIDDFYWSGAASSKFKALYKQLSPDFKKEVEKERKLMVKHPHTTCKYCHSVNWGNNLYRCGSCLNPLKGKVESKKKESDPSLKAPKEWWDKMVKKIKKGNPSYSEDQIAKTIGNIWANELSDTKKAEIRKRYGKHYGKAKVAANYRIVNSAENLEEEADSALMSEADKLKKYGAVVKTFKSSSNPNKTYEVRRLKGEEPTCNCPGWANRKTCKHVEEVKRILEEIKLPPILKKQVASNFY